MRITLRLIVALFASVVAVSALLTFLQVNQQTQAMRRDLEKRSTALAEGLQVSLIPLIERHSYGELTRVIESFSSHERLAGVAVSDSAGKELASTSGMVKSLKNEVAELARSSTTGASRFFHSAGSYWLLTVVPLEAEERPFGTVAILSEADFIERQRRPLWQATLPLVLAQVGVIVLITFLIVRWSISGPLARTAQWMRDLRIGRAAWAAFPEADFFKPLTQEVKHLVQSLASARAAAQQEARLRDAGESIWTAERLRAHVRSRIQDNPLFVVSNREPYMHVRRGKGIEVVVPASGLVTALEPILCVCDGKWIAHGSGEADREVVDQHDRLRVPPDQPEYTLRRVWLSKEEEEGYYYGFANEGLWPLCHIAHTRPIFRASDWQCYLQANQKFALAAVEEMKDAERPLLLVQDYHFAVLPRLIKEVRPDARVAIFWHIPWPNPEAFAICPWQRELLDGLLAADLIGFHIQAHCNNFLETVDQALESQVEWERFAVRRGGHLTHVRMFPISVAFPEASDHTPQRPSPHSLRSALLKELGVSARYLGVGVDRVDYTKGIPERFRAIERFLEKFPSYRGKFTFVQIAAPSRTHIKRYHDLLGEVEAEADRINWRFQSGDWKPIVLLTRHHSHQEIEPYYRAADLCMVTSLHDGMNLVAKEFVTAREDQEGALILSRFTGASRELRDALIANPYDTEQLAEAIRLALEMVPEERAARMRRMRQMVREHNVYRWAGNLIAELSEIRVDAAEPVPARTA